MKVAAIVATVFSLGAVFAGQRPQFRVTTELVRLDVVVVDDQGAAVRGLQPEDFVVTDRGASQVVKAEEYTDGPIDLVLVAPPIPAVAYTAAAQVPLVTSGLSAFFAQVRPQDRLGVVKAGAPPMRLRALEYGKWLFDPQTFSGGIDAAPRDAIAAALPLFVESDRRRALVAFTNAADFRSVVTFPILAEMAGRLGPAFVMVYTPINYGAGVVAQARLGSRDGPVLSEASGSVHGEAAPTNLQLLARRTGGMTLDLGSGRPADVIGQMFSWLRSGYFISYKPPVGTGWHPLTVKVNRRGLRVTARDGYVVD